MKPTQRGLELPELQKQLTRLSDPGVAAVSQRFFKTGSGQYGEGDLFRGIQVPTLRKLARQYHLLTLADTKKLLRSPYHEDRLLALLILTRAFKHANDTVRAKIFDFYLFATFHFIKRGEFSDALAIAEKLVSDREDLVHKAVGWMLREVGNQDARAEEEFLLRHYRQMPRVMLRYAIEKFPERKRQRFLNSKA